MEEVFAPHQCHNSSFEKKWPYVLKLLLLSLRNKIFIKSLSSYHSSPEENLELGIEKNLKMKKEAYKLALSLAFSIFYEVISEGNVGMCFREPGRVLLLFQVMHFSLSSNIFYY